MNLVATPPRVFERERPSPLSGITLGQLWALVVPTAFFLFTLGRDLGFTDLGYHLRAGQWMLHHGRLMSHDMFTSTFSGSDWLNQNWLAQLLLFKTWDVFGYDGLIALNALLYSAGFVVLFWVCIRRSQAPRAAALACVVAVLPAIYNTGTRPQALSWLLVATVVALIEVSKSRPKTLLWCIPLIALGANLHGAFAVGLLFLGVHTAASWLDTRRDHGSPARARLLTVTTAACAAVALFNPWGWKVYTYVLDIGSDPLIRGAIEEWQPPSFGDAAGVLFFLSVAVVVATLVLAKRLPSAADLLCLLVTAGLGLTAIRNGLWWTLAAAPAMATALSRRQWLAPRDEPRKVLNVAIVCLLVVIAALVSPWYRASSSERSSIVAESTPTAAGSYLNAHVLPGNLLNQQEFGSYFEWAAPRDEVFVDSRIELFPEGLWADYSTLMGAEPGWRHLLDERDIGHVVVSSKLRIPLVEALKRSPGWAEVFSDDVSVIFARRDGSWPRS
jgi:predicted transporter